jgi:hypothetical protein
MFTFHLMQIELYHIFIKADHWTKNLRYRNTVLIKKKTLSEKFFNRRMHNEILSNRVYYFQNVH